MIREKYIGVILNSLYNHVVISQKLNLELEMGTSQFCGSLCDSWKLLESYVFICTVVILNLSSGENKYFQWIKHSCLSFMCVT